VQPKIVALLVVTSVALATVVGLVRTPRAPPTPAFAPPAAAVVPAGVLLVVSGEGGPLPCRVHLKNDGGEPVAPPGRPFFYDHFAFTGSGRLGVTPGTYRYEIERGPEYRPSIGSFTAPADDAHPVVVKLERLVNLAARGYYAGDLHVHRPVADGELLLRAEDLTLGGFVTWWNDQPATVPAQLREQVRRFDGARFLDPTGGEDERQGGALLFFRLKQALALPHLYYEEGRIAHRAGAEADEYPSPVVLARQARAQGDVHVALEKPFWWDTPTWVALGLVDSVGIAHNHMARSQVSDHEAWGRPCERARYPEGSFANASCTQDIYYRLLDSGFRLAPSAGSASGVMRNPVGYDRVYVETGTPPDLDTWWRLLAEGRSFVTNGPLLIVQANGKPPGSVFTAAAGGSLALSVSIELASADPIAAVELVRDGSVTARGIYDGSTGRATLPPVVFERSGWFLVRALTARTDTFRFASTAPFYVEVGTVRRRISRGAVEYFRSWLDERVARLESSALPPNELSTVLAPHREAKRVWDERLARANAE
jgi:hypothetical protein